MGCAWNLSSAMKKQTKKTLLHPYWTWLELTFCMLGELSTWHQRVIINSLLKHFDGSELDVNNYLFIRSLWIACRNKRLSHRHTSATTRRLPPSFPASIPPPPASDSWRGTKANTISCFWAYTAIMLPATWDEEERSPVRIQLPGHFVQLISLSLRTNW